MENSKTLLPAVISIAMLAATPVFSGDAAKGEKVFKKCKACHLLEDTGKKKTGPHLENIIGRPAGIIEGFKYSNALLEAAENGLVWDEAALDAFFTKPKDFIPKTKMSFNGLKKESDRENLIAYLASLSTGDVAASDEPDPDADPEVAADILAIVGDVEYGEYLASGCVSCHQADGSDQGLPSIVGWPAEAFVTVMHSYKIKHRENPVMQQIAGALSNDEIAALAAYFEKSE